MAIETQGEHTLGRTVVDWSRRTRHAPNALVINQIDADGFFALLTERLGRLPLPCKARHVERRLDERSRTHLGSGWHHLGRALAPRPITA